MQHKPLSLDVKVSEGSVTGKIVAMRDLPDMDAEDLCVVLVQTDENRFIGTVSAEGSKPALDETWTFSKGEPFTVGTKA